jgi:hypothetical protein
VLAIGDSFPWVEQQERESDHSPFSVTAKLGIREAVTPLPHTPSWHVA